MISPLHALALCSPDGLDGLSDIERALLAYSPELAYLPGECPPREELAANVWTKRRAARLAKLSPAEFTALLIAVDVAIDRELRRVAAAPAKP